MLVDRNELRACMVRKGLIQTQIAKKIGISAPSFNLKLLGKREFNETEIERLVSEFGTSFLNLP